MIQDFDIVVECNGEDAPEEDLALIRAIEERQHEPNLAFEEVVSELRLRTPARA